MLRGSTTCSMSGHFDMPLDLSSAESARLCFMGIFISTAYPQPSGVTAPWDLTVPAAMYIMTKQDLTKRKTAT